MSGPDVGEEAGLDFDCFGGTVAIRVGDRDRDAAERALRRSQQLLLEIHAALSRFRADSELSRLNADPRRTVPVGPHLLRLATAVVEAGELSGGLVDATILPALESAGYRDSLVGATPVPLELALTAAPPRRAATPRDDSRWHQIGVNDAASTVTRPPGLRIDSGGLAKGLAADLVATSLEAHSTYAVDCGGDIRLGGHARKPRRLFVADPFGGDPVHELELVTGAVATSGVGRRSWLRPDGTPAHHLLDPRTGEPAYTGVVQATAIAATAFLAEILAKVAVLSGPDGATTALPHGGVLVLEDRSVEVVPASRTGGVEARAA